MKRTTQTNAVVKRPSGAGSPPKRASSMAYMQAKYLSPHGTMLDGLSKYVKYQLTEDVAAVYDTTVANMHSNPDASEDAKALWRL